MELEVRTRTNIQTKELIRSPTVLAHYDGTQTLVLTCDASLIGVGAVIVHRTKEGAERPIAFESITLSPTEKILATQQGSVSDHFWCQKVSPIPSL